MEMAPGTMVADAYVAHLAFQAVVALDGNGKRLGTLRRGDDAAVAIGLLDEVIVLLDIAKAIAIELLIPLHGAKIGGGEKSFQC